MTPLQNKTENSTLEHVESGYGSTIDAVNGSFRAVPICPTDDGFSSKQRDDVIDQLTFLIPPPPPPHHPNEKAANAFQQRVLIKTQNSTFYQDAREFRPGSIPHSMVLALTIGSLCGAAAAAYYAVLEFMLEFVWHTLPEMWFIEHVAEQYHVLWIPLVGFFMALMVGLTVRFVGEPGDLPYTIRCVHEKAYVSMDHVLPMLAASQFSIIGGGSLGPEAPLVAICASLGGWVSRYIFGMTDRNLVRKHTLMGMAGALAAFFGCPLGGSLFALEVNSRFGIEYFEHTLEAILCGEVCLGVFRGISKLPIQPIWDFTDPQAPAFQHLLHSDPMDVLYGIFLGLIGAGVAGLFARFHQKVMDLFRKFHLIDECGSAAIPRALAGAVVVVGLGMVIPHTMFWGESEIQTIGTLASASTLEHIWPTTGLLGFQMDSFCTCLIVAFTKLVAISFTVAGGYRGGYIFPAFAAGCALGRAIYFLCPFIPVQLCMLCMAASLNVGLTRTALATTIILTYLSGEQNSTTPILASALVSLFATGYIPFIPSQIVRNDLENSLFHAEEPAQVDDADQIYSLKQRLRKKMPSPDRDVLRGVPEENETPTTTHNNSSLLAETRSETVLMPADNLPLDILLSV